MAQVPTSARSEVVITPPCHGGDRRFKSGRARQKKTPILADRCFLLCKVACDSNRANNAVLIQTAKNQPVCWLAPAGTQAYSL